MNLEVFHLIFSGFFKVKCQRNSSPDQQRAWTRKLWAKACYYLDNLGIKLYNLPRVCAETDNLPETSGKTCNMSRAASPVSNKIDRGKIARMKERRACIILGNTSLLRLKNNEF